MDLKIDQLKKIKIPLKSCDDHCSPTVSLYDAFSSFLTVKPANLFTALPVTGTGTQGNPLTLSPMGATPGMVLTFNGTSWVPATSAASPQTLSFTSPILSISGGNSVDLSTLSVPPQTLSIFGYDLSISGGNTVNLPSEWQTLTLVGNDLSIGPNGNTITLPIQPPQTLTSTSDATSHTVTLSNSGGSVQLVEGAGISLTTTGTASDGIVTIANTAITPPALPFNSVQWNNAGAFGGDAGFVYDNTTKSLTLNNTGTNVLLTLKRGHAASTAKLAFHGDQSQGEIWNWLMPGQQSYFGGSNNYSNHFALNNPFRGYNAMVIGLGSGADSNNFALTAYNGGAFILNNTNGTNARVLINYATNVATPTDTALRVKGHGATSATWGLQVHNSTGTNNALMVRDDGRIGIGTSSPENKLHVSSSAGGSIDPVLQVSSNATYTGLIVNATKAGGTGQPTFYLQKNGTSVWAYGSDYAANGTKDFFVYDSTNSRNPLFITALGEVRIGNTSSSLSGGYFGTQKLTIKPTGVIQFNDYPNTLNSAGSPVNVLTTDASGNLESHTVAEVVSSGGGISGTLAATQIGYGSGVNTLTGSADFIYDSVDKRIAMGTATHAASILTVLDDGAAAAPTYLPLAYITNGDFTTDLTGWAGANWSWNAGTALHTVGSTASLTQSVTLAAPLVAYSPIKLDITVTGRTAGSFGVTLDGKPFTVINASTQTINANGTFSLHVNAPSTLGSKVLAIVPTTDFNGAVDAISLSYHQKAIPQVRINTTGLPNLDFRYSAQAAVGTVFTIGNNAAPYLFAPALGQINAIVIGDNNLPVYIPNTAAIPIISIGNNSLSRLGNNTTTYRANGVFIGHNLLPVAELLQFSNEGVYIGNNLLGAVTNSSESMYIGNGGASGVTSMASSVILGSNALLNTTTATYVLSMGFATGRRSSGALSHVMLFGRGATSNISNAVIFGGIPGGGNEFNMRSMWMGSPDGSTSANAPIVMQLRRSGIASSEPINTSTPAGTLLETVGANGIGTGTGGDVALSVILGGSSGTAQNTTTTKSIRVLGTSGNVQIQKSTAQIAPADNGALLQVQGSGSTSATWTAQFHNSTGTNNALMVRDDGFVGIANNAPSYSEKFKVTGKTFIDQGGGALYAPVSTEFGTAIAARFTGQTNVSGLLVNSTMTGTNSGYHTGIESQFGASSGGSSNITQLGFVATPNAGNLTPLTWVGYHVNPYKTAGAVHALSEFTGYSFMSALGSQQLQGQATSTITNVFAFKASPGAPLNTTIANYYGLYLNTLTSTNEWGVYQISASAKNYFNGITGIATASPQQTLHVAGTMRLTGSDGTATTIMGRDADGDISTVALGEGVSISGGTLTGAAPTIGYIEGSTATSIDLDANVGEVKDIDGTNIAFTLPTNLDRFEVYKNGVLQNRTGSLTTRDYSLNTGTNTITFVVALLATDTVIIKKS